MSHVKVKMESRNDTASSVTHTSCPGMHKNVAVGRGFPVTYIVFSCAINKAPSDDHEEMPHHCELV